MTLGELKIYAVKLIDEYTNNTEITDDKDIKNKLNELFNIGQIEVALISKINKVFEFEIKEVGKEEYNSNTLPSDFMEINKIRFFPYSNNSILNYYMQNRKIKTHKNCLGKFEIEYFATPRNITSETEDDYEFSLSIEAQMVIPYYVASDILKSDVSTNYTALEAKYNAKLEALKNSVEKQQQSSITINQMIGNL